MSYEINWRNYINKEKKFNTTVTHFIFCSYLFLCFNHRGHFHSDLFSQTAKSIKMIFVTFGAVVHKSVCNLV